MTAEVGIQATNFDFVNLSYLEISTQQEHSHNYLRLLK